MDHHEQSQDRGFYVGKLMVSAVVFVILMSPAGNHPSLCFVILAFCTKTHSFFCGGCVGLLERTVLNQIIAVYSVS